MSRTSRLLQQSSIALVLIASLLSWGSDYALAQSSSASFNNISESINCGGATSSSASFKLNDTVCDQSTGGSTSTSFANVGGFQAQEDIPRITFTLSKNTIALGNLSTGSVSSDFLTTRVITNAVGGYTTSIRAQDGLKNGAGDEIDPVGDGTVTAGSEEYGFRTANVVGTDGLFNGADQGISTTAQDYASNAGPSDATTQLTFKAAISTITPAGDYTQTVYLVASGRF